MWRSLLAWVWIASLGCGDGVVTPDGGTIADGASRSFVLVQRIPGGWMPTDLTAAGTVDWVHWGRNGASGNLGEINRKAGVTRGIGDYARLGTGMLRWDSGIEPVMWTDGAPTAMATGVDTYHFIDTPAASGDGFEFVVAADPAPRRFVIYTGQWCSNVRLAAMLDDGTAPPDEDTSWDITIPHADIGRYAVDFATPTPGASLHVQFVIADNHCTTGDVGELWLFAATLAST